MNKARVLEELFDRVREAQRAALIRKLAIDAAIDMLAKTQQREAGH